ncbi:MAG: hypothetical protein KGJ90_02420 [Patescibacteria group bacterium]|nr:hypothetical protein [Patescibacteria group bacterium]
MTIQDGDIILVHGGTDLLSKLIRFFSRSDYSHTALGAGIYNGQQMAFEARALVLLTEWNNGAGRGPVKVYSWTKPEHQAIAAQAVEGLVNELNGSYYGFAQLLWFIWRWTVDSLHLPHRLAVHNWMPGGRICTEVVYLAIERTCQKIGFPFYYEYGLNAVTPEDISAILSSLAEHDLVKETV